MDQLLYGNYSVLQIYSANIQRSPIFKEQILLLSALKPSFTHPDNMDDVASFQYLLQTHQAASAVSQ